MKPVFTASVLVLLETLAWAQSPGTSPSVRATGHGLVSVKPDQAKIDIGVVTQAGTARAAAAQNAAQSQAVLDKLHAALGSKADIKTTSYSVNPNYQYPRDGGNPTISGYTAANTVEVTIGDLADTGKVIDLAAEGGANQIQRLQFTLKDEKPAQAQALRQAALEARSNAEAMAGALGLKLGRVITLEQENPQVIRPVMAMAASARSATPVEPAAIEVSASVTLVITVE